MNEKENLSTFVTEKKGKLCFFGSGEVCSKMLWSFSLHRLAKPLAIIDNNKEKQGTTKEDIPIISLETAMETYSDLKILITNVTHIKEMEAQLKENLIDFISLKAENIYEFYKNLDPSDYDLVLQDFYFWKTGEILDLENPKTFNEKIQWMKLYDSTPLKTRLADKYLVREWIREKMGEEYLIPLLGIWDSFDHIDFDTLPSQFALKTNHGCGWNYIVKDKTALDKEKMKTDFDKWMGTNFAYCAGLELHYRDIVPKIIAEEYIQNFDDLYEYKLMCFQGKVEFLWVCTGRSTNLKRSFYDVNWNCLPVSFSSTPVEKDLKKPQTFEKMIKFAEDLSKEFACVRIDFYDIEGKLYFGEMTFTSETGLMKVEPESENCHWGDFINLPMKQVKVSVVIPVYNVKQYLKESMDSICNQTLKEIEIICVDDGSTDGSLGVLQEYAKKDSRVIVLENHKKGPGAAHARNMGLDHAKGEYLLIIDSDDYLDLTLAEKAYNKAKKNQVDILMYDAIHFDTETREEIPVRPEINTRNLPSADVFSAEDTKDFMVVGLRSVPWGQMYLRSFVNENNLRFQAVAISDDEFFVFTTSALAKRFTTLPERLIYHRMNYNESQTANLDKGLMTVVEVSKALKHWLEEHDLFEKLETRYLQKSLQVLFFYFWGFRQFDNFQTLFKVLHSGVFTELGWDRVFEKEMFQSHKLILQYIQTYENAETFLFREFVYHLKNANYPVFGFEFPPDMVEPEEKILLYGAGAVGKAYYTQNVHRNFCKIVAWVDKNFENIGFPVTGLESLNQTDFDFIVMAVESKTLAEEIKKELISLGVQGEKIKWCQPEYKMSGGSICLNA